MSALPEPEPEPEPSKNIVPFEGKRFAATALPTEDKVRAALLNPLTPGSDGSDGKPPRAPRPKTPATEEQIEIALWLLGVARACGMTTYAAIGQLVKKDASMMSRYFRGDYDSDLSGLTAHIQRFRADWNSQQKLGEMPFVSQLSVVRKIGTFAEMVRLTRQMGPLWGDSQIGKSLALEHIAADDSKDTILFRLAASGTQKDSINALAEACGVPTRKDDHEKRDRILKRIKPQTLLIVDEFHQAFVGRKLKMGLIERIREIHDLCKCGVLLCGTHIFVEMLSSEKFKDFLSQINRRGVLRMFIPTAPEPGDLELLFAAYKLPPPDGRAATIAKQLSAQHGIGELTKYFQVARFLAMNETVPMGWDHFLKAHDTLITIANPANKSGRSK